MLLVLNMLLVWTISKLTSLVIATLLKYDILIVKLVLLRFILLLSNVGWRGTLIIIFHHSAIHSLKSLRVGRINLTIRVVYGTQCIKMWWILARNRGLSYSLLPTNHTSHCVIKCSTWIWTLRSRWQIVGLSLHCAARVAHVWFIFQNDLIVIYLSRWWLGLHLLPLFRIHFFKMSFLYLFRRIYLFF